ncbi:class I SAM-dependent methyltransferase [Chryseobacterium viscerum]|uniref:Class I SAM-dependent methyltransferase n=1 Tax=Chryseobacterium viscerum TaxID=1037377 RepID=A0A5N4BUP8_9FLAO|nr:class I SAM-dependent methyltransferase [Chryseobacterium viscerum]KAB1232132.1 class I SAM-dependent methyltransferase [Chryseobacterium viscerum]
MENYKNKVQDSAQFYNSSFLDFDFKLTELNYLSLKPYFKGESALELGPALGHMTKYLVNDFSSLDLVEGSKDLINQIPDYPNITKHNSYFEEFKTDKKFDTIIMSHVLEHIENPVDVLKLVYSWLSDNGVFLISVPNAKSIHRLAAVEMGLLNSEYELNQRDHELGHYRVYDLDTLKNDITKAGYTIIDEGGIFFKPVSNGQIENNWNEAMIEGFYKLGKKFPHHCAEIYVACSK